MKKTILVTALYIAVLLCGAFYSATAKCLIFENASECDTMQGRSTEWRNYGEVTSLCFNKYDATECAYSDPAALNYSISDKFWELENAEGYLLKPYTVSIDIEYRYIDGEKQFRTTGDKRNGDIYKKQTYVYFSLNPYSSVEYVINSNNRPSMRKRDVSAYSHFVDDNGDFYFIKMQ